MALAINIMDGNGLSNKAYHEYQEFIINKSKRVSNCSNISYKYTV